MDMDEACTAGVGRVADHDMCDNDPDIAEHDTDTDGATDDDGNDDDKLGVTLADSPDDTAAGMEGMTL